jgi:hypothetical protein
MYDLIRYLIAAVAARLMPPPKGRHARPRVQLATCSREVAESECVVPPVPARSLLPLPHCGRVPWPQVSYPSDRARAQRQRRTALVLATWGIDVGPRRIHGVRVGAVAAAVAR